MRIQTRSRDGVPAFQMSDRRSRKAFVRSGQCRFQTLSDYGFRKPDYFKVLWQLPNEMVLD